MPSKSPPALLKSIRKAYWKIYLNLPSTDSPKYKLEGVDATVLLLCFMVMLEMNEAAQLDFATYKWLARWLNQNEISYDQGKLREYLPAATE